MMKQLARVVCFLIAFGGLAIAARAQTPIDPSSVPDAGMRLSTPDACDPPYEICFEYTGTTLPAMGMGSVLNVSFEASPDPTIFDPSTTSYMCSVSGSSAEAAIAQGMPGLGSPIPISCDVVDPVFDGVGYFEELGLYIPGAFQGETVGMTVTGGSVSLTDLSSDLPCTSCGGSPTFTVDPVPEPGTSLLYVSGLLLFSLVAFARKRFGANSVA
jgi:hypothetical protein